MFFPSTPPKPEESVTASTAVPPSEALLDAVSAEHAELQRQGAKAAARGEAQASNPMLATINKPVATGETVQVWSDRRDAWDRGHDAQQRPMVLPAQAPAGMAANERDQDEALFGVTRILTFAGDQGLTSASGFFFERDSRLFLVTSRHVLFDEPTDHGPDRIEINLHIDGRDLTKLVTLSILLHRNGLTVWNQARDSAGEVDVAVLEIDRAALPVDCIMRPFGPQHLPVGFDLFEVGDRLAIPGFPLGFFDTLHHLPVVRQASVASWYGIRFQGLGYFLTDARLHRGSSGSPVLARVEPASSGRPRWCLLGVHSSRMDMATRDAVLDDSLGLNCAWYADVLLTLTSGASRNQP
jgi:S1-C subfamily serine protease